MPSYGGITGKLKSNAYVSRRSANLCCCCSPGSDDRYGSSPGFFPLTILFTKSIVSTALSVSNLTFCAPFFARVSIKVSYCFCYTGSFDAMNDLWF